MEDRLWPGVWVLLMQAGAFAVGGYVAARMARNRAVAHALGAWVVAMAATGADAIEGWVRDPSAGVLAGLDLPHWLDTGLSGDWERAIALVAIALAALAGALVGGAVGAAANRAALIPPPGGGGGASEDGAATRTIEVPYPVGPAAPVAADRQRHEDQQDAGGPGQADAHVAGPRPAEHQRAHRVDGRRHRLVLGERREPVRHRRRSRRRRSTRTPAAAGAGRTAAWAVSAFATDSPTNAKTHDSEKPKSSSTTRPSRSLADVWSGAGSRPRSPTDSISVTTNSVARQVGERAPGEDAPSAPSAASGAAR